MRAVITVVGKDMVGILSGVSEACAKNSVNIIEVSQSILQELFCMIMLVDLGDSGVDVASLSRQLKEFGEERALQINVMHEDVFNTMHHI